MMTDGRSGYWRSDALLANAMLTSGHRPDDSSALVDALVSIEDFHTTPATSSTTQATTRSSGRTRFIYADLFTALIASTP